MTAIAVFGAIGLAALGIISIFSIIAYADAAETAKRRKTLLAETRRLLVNCSVESGTCCCGEEMANHTPLGNHSPVDSGGHYAAQLVKVIDEELKK